ncbi:carbohydrate ABC transporter permease [Xylanimonas protaetiae]|nr:sugar ABC transporter permease [Xylanimonas protaetiae]
MFSINLALPSILLLGFAQIWPMIQGITYSFQKGVMAKPSQGWVGLENYRTVLRDPAFWDAVQFTIVFTIGGVVLSYVLGLVLALALVRNIPMRGFIRVGLILPWVVPPIVGMNSWRWMLQDQAGAVNQVITFFGGQPIFFFNDPDMTVVAVIIAKAWRSFPFMLVSLMATLSSLDDNILEAASIDGANAWKKFWSITFPQILPMSAILWVLMTIWSVNDYETPYLLTNNSANARNMMIYTFDTSIFGLNGLGVGSASAVITLAVLGVLAYFMLKLQKAGGNEG